MPDAPHAPAAPHALDSGRQQTHLARMLRAFANRNYRLFFTGQLTSLTGTFLAQVAVVWLVYGLSKGDPLMLGIVGFCGQIPMFAVAPFAGVWVDRLDRRKLLVVTQALSMLQSFALGWLVLAGLATVPAVAALALCQGLINAFDMPARQAFLVEMIRDPRDLPNAIALNSTMVHTARLIGPALAGFLLYWVGPGWCFLLDGFSYAGVIASLLAMRNLPVRAAPPRGRSVLHELKEGLAYAWHFPPIRAMLLLTAILSLTGMPAFMTLIPLFAAEFGGPEKGSQVLGFLMGASGLGALIGAIYLASRRSVVGLGGVICAAAGIFGAALIAFSFSRHLGLSIAFVAVSGWAMMMNFASSNTLLQTLCDEDKRGRVMSFFIVAFIGVAPFGNLLAGALARALGGGGHDGDHLLGATYTLRIEGAICIAAAIGFGAMLPALRDLTRPVYLRKGILPPEVAEGIDAATEVVSGPER